MFGETDIIFERNRAQNFVAKEDCYILKLEKQAFKDILLEFPDFYKEVEKMTTDRELERIQNEKKEQYGNPEGYLDYIASQLNQQEKKKGDKVKGGDSKDNSKLKKVPSKAGIKKSESKLSRKLSKKGSSPKKNIPKMVSNVSKNKQLR